MRWIPPLGGVLKFNVNELTRGKPRPASIGGVCFIIVKGKSCWHSLNM